jgi:hypothetical protein
MNIKGLALIFLALTAIFAGCTKPEEKLWGTWKIRSGKTDVYFTFLKNNELNVNDEVFMKYFVTKDKKLVLGMEEPVSFAIKNNILRINQEGHILTYVKVK